MLSYSRLCLVFLLSSHFFGIAFFYYYGYFGTKPNSPVIEAEPPSQTKPPPQNEPPPHTKPSKPIICVAMPVTTRMMENVKPSTLPLFEMFLQTFLEYSEPDLYTYYLYLGYDKGDSFYDNTKNREDLLLYFSSYIKGFTLSPSSFILKLFPTIYPQHPTKGVPAWVASDMARLCYNDSAEYIFKLNDDVTIETKGFTSILIDDLQKRPIPNFGINCPLHTGGKTTICVIDFTHRTHLDVFPYHYPRAFTDWYCDDWISFVYGVLNDSPFSKQIDRVRANHHVRQQRYEVGSANCNTMKEELTTGRDMVTQYVKENYPSFSYSFFGDRSPC